MKKVLLAIVAVTIVTALGIHFHVSRQVDSGLQALASKLVSAGRLEWGSIRVNHRGDIDISQLRFVPMDSSDSITVGQVRLRAGSLPAALTFGQQWQAGQLPARLTLEVHDLTLPVIPEIDQLLDTRLSVALPHAGAGCSGLEELGIHGLIELGIWQLKIDLDLEYALVNQDEHLHLTWQVRADSLSQWSGRVRLAVDLDSRTLDTLPQALGDGGLLMLDLEYHDLGLINRLVEHCARQRDETAAEFRAAHLQAWHRRWREAGLEPSPLVIAGYEYFLFQPVSIGIQAQLDSEAEIAHAQPGFGLDRLSEMGAEFNINNGSGVPMGFARLERSVTAPPPVIVQDEDMDTPPVTEPVSVESSLPGVLVGPGRGWREIEPRLTGEHVGQSARLHLASGDRFSGLIVAVENGQVHLSTRSRQGQFIRPFALREIEKVEVRP
jgi:hypothetical protein